MNLLIQVYIDWLIKNRVIALLLVVLVASVSGYGLKYTKVVTDYDVFFEGDNARLTAYKDIQNQYGKLDSVLISVTPHSGSVFNEEVLGAIREFTDQAWMIPYTSRVDSLTNHQYFYDSNETLVVEDLFPDYILPTQEHKKRVDYALNDPSIVNHYTNPDGTVAGLMLTLRLNDVDPKTIVEANSTVVEMINGFERRYPDLSFHLSGSTALNAAFYRESTTGTASLIGISFIVILVMTAVLLRSVLSVIPVAMMTFLSLLSGVGLASWLSLPFTASSSVIPMIVTAICVANCIHIISSVLSQITNTDSRAAAIKVAFSKNAVPVLLALFTTGIGFLCLNFSDVPPYRYLGIASALCVSFCLLYTFTLLPAILSFFPLKPSKSGKKITTTESSFLKKLGSYSYRHRKGILIFSVLLSVVFTSLALKNEITDSLVTYFEPGTTFRDDTDYYMENYSYFHLINLTLPAGEENGISNPDFMRDVDELVTWVREQPEVKAVVTYTDFFKKLNQAMNANDQSFYRLPTDSGLAAQYMLIYEMSVPYGLDLSNMIALDKSNVRLNIGMHNVSSAQLRDFDERLRVKMRSVSDEQFGRSMPTGAMLLFANIWKDSVIGNLKGMFVAVFLIAVVISLGLKSIKLGLISIIPNLLPAVITFGLWKLIDGEIDIGSAMVVIVSLGIVVDDTVHLLARFKYAYYELKMSTKECIEYSITQVGRALAISTLVLSVSFAMLITSSYTINSHLGILTCLLVNIALICDFTILFAILAVTYSRTESLHAVPGR